MSNDTHSIERYPLWCVDRGESYGESQYLGPYDTEKQATGNSGPDDDVRRCRAVKASEIGLDVEDSVVAWLDDRACSGELPDGGWANFDEPIIADLSSVGIAAFWVWANRYLLVKSFVCEGDEA